MIGSVLLLVALAAEPTVVTIASVKGERQLSVTRDDAGAPVLAAAELLDALGGSIKRTEGWIDVTLARQQLRFLVDAPYYVVAGRVQPMVGSARRRGDSLFLPLAFVTNVLPLVMSERYRWDPADARLTDVAWRMVRGATPPRAPEVAAQPVTKPPARTARASSQLHRTHVVTVDAGHGGEDPGNPGLYFPAGVREKHVTLQVSLLVRDELERRGIEVRMTRTTDTRPDLLKRATLCREDCDLFVSIHVDALPRSRSDYRSISGFSTLIIGEENTEDANRIANLENEALRFEDTGTAADQAGELGFILRDLQMNEFLRESERAGALIQRRMEGVHTGVNRGVKQSNRLAVLNTARRPAVLVELGYSTNRDDARLLTQRSSQVQLARALADAIVDYLTEFERATGDSLPAGAP